MATFQQVKDDLVACPYNKAHRVKQSRYQLHITKCQRDHPEVPKSVCAFNAQHRIDPAEHQHHVVTCADRAPVDRRLLCDDSSRFKGRMAVPSYTSENDTQQCGENWNNEIDENEPGYDPQKSQLYYPDVTGMKPSEKRKVYKGLHSNPDATFHPRAQIRNELESHDGPGSKMVLKELRQPRRDHLTPVFQNMKEKEAEQHIQKVSLGRGESHRRIAANIFGDKQEPPKQNSLLNVVRLGRGLPCASLPTALQVGRSAGDNLPPLAPGQVEDVEP